MSVDDNQMDKLRHVVGKSTLSEGISVPRQLEAWVDAPPIGQKRDVTLRFAGSCVTATLRRLGNERGHVQIKYENNAGEPFRNWLNATFAGCRSAQAEDFIELRKTGADTYDVAAFPAIVTNEEHLEVKEWVFHKGDPTVLDTYVQIREIPAVVGSVLVVRDKGQDYYNGQLSHFFRMWQWGTERRVIPELPLKADFVKDDVVVEVEFGNARTYYQDYVKFMLAHHARLAEIGVLIVPTEDFARHLCGVGRLRAEAKGRHSYSGMIHLEKVRRELTYLEFMLAGPVAVAGIGIRPV